MELAKFIAFYVMTSLGFLASMFVVASIVKAGTRAISSKLLVYFHVTLLLDIVSTLPYAYAELSPIACSFASWLHVYCGLANCFVTFFIVLYNRNLLLNDEWAQLPFRTKWRMEILIFFVPCIITSLPLSTNAYSNMDHKWCLISTSEPVIWTTIWTCIYFLFVVPLWAAGVSIMISTVLRIYRMDTEVTVNLVSTIGLYCLLGNIALGLRILFFLGFFGLYSTIGFSVYAILFLLIFLRERKSLILFELFKQQEGDDYGDSIVNITNLELCEGSFSWEVDEAHFPSNGDSDAKEGVLEERSASNSNTTCNNNPTQNVHLPSEPTSIDISSDCNTHRLNPLHG